MLSLVASGCFVSLSAQGTPNPVPLINQPLVPAAASPGGPGFTLTVNGTGFVPGSVVNWNGGVRTTTFVSAGQLTATIFASDIATAGTASVTVRNPSPGGGISNVMFFSVSTPATTVTFSSFVQNLGFATFPSIVTADFNGDGKPDLAGLTSSGLVWISLGNGDGTFQSPGTFATGQSGEFLLAADFNNDGKPDLAVSNTTNDTISILLGNGDGTFRTPMTFLGSVPISNPPLAVADFNGDGNLDLARAGHSGSISIFLGNGDGTFQAGIVSPIMQPNPNISFISPMTVGDFNRDGKLDIAIGWSNSSSLGAAVLLGNGDGTFQTTPIVSTVSSQGISTSLDLLPAADVDGDGKLDLILGYTFQFGGCSPTTSVLLGNGDGSFRSGAGGSGMPLWAADFNADGKLDILFSFFANSTNCNSGVISAGILLGNGDGTFQSNPLTISGPGQVGDSIVRGDFNGDGKIDFGSVNSGNVADIFLQGQQDFSLIPISPTSVAVTRGQTANFRLTVVPTDAFNQTVAFTCSGAPSQSTCTVSSSSIALNGTTTVTVAVSTTAPSFVPPDRPGSIPTITGGYRPVFLISGLLALMASLAGRRRDRRLRFISGLTLLLLLYAGMTMAGCGGSGSQGTLAGNYTLTVTGSSLAGSTTLTHSTSLMLTVNN